METDLKEYRVQIQRQRQKTIDSLQKMVSKVKRLIWRQDRQNQEQNRVKDKKHETETKINREKDRQRQKKKKTQTEPE